MEKSRKCLETISRKHFMKEVEVRLVLTEWKGFVHIEMKGQDLARWREQYQERNSGRRVGDMCCE